MFISCCWYLYLVFEHQPSWFCIVLLLKPCFYKFIFEFETWQLQRIIVLIVQHAYLDNRSSLIKILWNKYGKLVNLTARAAAAADFFGPARRFRQPKLTGALPPTQWCRRRALSWEGTMLLSCCVGNNGISIFIGFHSMWNRVSQKVQRKLQESELWREISRARVNISAEKQEQRRPN